MNNRENNKKNDQKTALDLKLINQKKKKTLFWFFTPKPTPIKPKIDIIKPNMPKIITITSKARKYEKLETAIDAITTNPIKTIPKITIKNRIQINWQSQQSQPIIKYWAKFKNKIQQKLYQFKI